MGMNRYDSPFFYYYFMDQKTSERKKKRRCFFIIYSCFISCARFSSFFCAFQGRETTTTKRFAICFSFWSVIIADGRKIYKSRLTLFFCGFIMSMPSAMVGFDRRNLHKDKVKENKERKRFTLWIFDDILLCFSLTQLRCVFYMHKRYIHRRRPVKEWKFIIHARAV